MTRGAHRGALDAMAINPHTGKDIPVDANSGGLQDQHERTIRVLTEIKNRVTVGMLIQTAVVVIAVLWLGTRLSTVESSQGDLWRRVDSISGASQGK